MSVLSESTYTEACAILQSAQCLHDTVAVNQALQSLADQITVTLQGRCPVVLVVMKGALIFAGKLLPLLNFPLELDYCQATRYGNQMSGAEQVTWQIKPGVSLADRDVLVLDDIFDEGHTLLAVCDAVHRLGAASVTTAVLCEKQHTRQKAMVVDYVGLNVPDCFVFGMGMDIQQMWRNLPAIYACS